MILSGHTLFTEGVAARLRKHEDWLDLHVVDADQGDALLQIVSAKPSAVILDADDPQVTRNCSLNQLFQALPKVRIVRLDPERAQLQLLTSEPRLAADIADLISVIQPPGGLQGVE